MTNPFADLPDPEPSPSDPIEEALAQEKRYFPPSTRQAANNTLRFLWANVGFTCAVSGCMVLGLLIVMSLGVLAGVKSNAPKVVVESFGVICLAAIVLLCVASFFWIRGLIKLAHSTRLFVEDPLFSTYAQLVRQKGAMWTTIAMILGTLLALQLIPFLLFIFTVLGHAR